MPSQLKAYMVHPGQFSDDAGCMLVFAKSRNDAKMYAFECGWWEEWEYIEFRAIRKPEYDKYSDQCGMSVETNAGLPEGAPPFYDDEKDYYQDAE